MIVIFGRPLPVARRDAARRPKTTNCRRASWLPAGDEAFKGTINSFVVAGLDRGTDGVLCEGAASSSLSGWWRWQITESTVDLTSAPEAILRLNDYELQISFLTHILSI